MGSSPKDSRKRPLEGFRLALGLAACGASAAATWVGHEPGLAVLLSALLLAGVIAAARPTRLSGESIVAAALALLLVSTAVVVDAGWVLAFNLLYALGLGSYALVGGRRFSEVGRACLRFLARLPEGVAIAFSPLARTAKPAFEERARPYARGALFASTLVLVFGGLFVTADPVFRELTSSVFTPDLGDLNLFPRIIVLLFVMMLGGALVAAGDRFGGGLERDDGDPYGGETRAKRRTDWLIPLVVLDLLFAGFVAVQLAVLFGGRRHVLETTGLSFAEYARQGFFQLVLVSILTLAVVATAVRWANVERGRDRLLLRIVLGVLCLLTLVILASALRRLSLYEATFGATRLRISVHATILWLAGIFVMVLVAGAAWRARWLARAALFSTACGLLAFTAINPERVIARENMERWQRTGDIDLAYLETLSADAVPALVALPDPARSCVLERHFDLRDEADWQSFNLSRAEAAGVLRSTDTSGCPIPTAPHWD